MLNFTGALGRHYRCLFSLSLTAFLYSLRYLFILITVTFAQECFEQQYSNAVADLRSTHIIQRVAVVAPLGAFYVQSASDFADAQFAYGDSTAYIRRSNGEPIVVYASTSSVTLEWQPLNVIASAVRIVSVYEADEAQVAQVSPILIINACPYKFRTIYLDAQPFSVSSVEAGLASMYENELIVNFRTFESGIFLFSMADQGDLLVAQLNNGRVETFFDFGALSRSSLSGGRALNDGGWHELRWTHQFDAVQLFVDKVLVNTTTPSGLYRKLDFNHQIEIGGRAEDQYSSDILTNFHGCLARVQLNNVNLLQFAPDTNPSCQLAQPQTISIDEGGAVRIAYSFLPFSLEFRVPQQPAVLLAVLNEANETLLDLRVDDNRQLVLEAENRQIRQVSLPAIVVNDGNWHALTVKLRGGRLDVEVDAYTALWLEGALVRRIGVHMAAFRLEATGCYRSTTVDLRSSADIATVTTPARVHKDKCLYFERCLPNPCQNGGICVQSNLKAFRCDCTKYYTGTYCQISLFPRSCEDYHHNKRRLFRVSSPSTLSSAAVATAMSSNNGASVLIKSLQQFGLSSNAHADLADDSPPRSAIDGENGERITIDLDGGGPLRPFVVNCLKSNVTGKASKPRQPTSPVPSAVQSVSASEESSAVNEDEETTTTSAMEEIDEDEEGEVTLLRNDLGASGVLVADGPTEPGAVRRTLDYGIEGVELDRFVDGFDSCRQHMRFECRGGTRLMTYGIERRPSTWYATRGGQHGLQWANAPPYSRMCACALNATCESNKMCNCDSGRDAVDEGYSHFQHLLPILQLFVGGTTAARKSSARVTVGALRCVRRKVFGAVTFVSRNAQLVDTQTFDSPIFDLYVQVRFAHEHMTIFTWESTNEQRWFQLLTRDGRLIGQLVNAGHSHEIVSDVTANDGVWHNVHWTIDRYSMRLVIDRHEKTLTDIFLLPITFTFIIGSRTTRGGNGFAGQLRNLYLAGNEIQLRQLAEKLHPAGVHVGETGFCNIGAQSLLQRGDYAAGDTSSRSVRCANGGVCVEMFDRFKCNCSDTSFAGDRCDQEVGVWVPAGSQLSIPWQHPSQTASTCHAISVYTQSVDVSLVRARALFAESSFNLSIDAAGHLTVEMFDGFFFTHNVSFNKFTVSDSKLKSIKFCATRDNFYLTVNKEPAISLDGNFTFFQHFNVWNFIDKNFTGCVSRLKVGSGFPLKNPTLSRLSHSPGVRFASCPFDPLEYHKNDEMRQFSNNKADIDDERNDEIHVTAIMKSQQRLLLITPAIGLLAAVILALALFIFVCYVRSRPDGVYKTNENFINGYPASSSGGSSSAGAAGGVMTASSLSALSRSGEPLIYGASAQITSENGVLNGNKTYLQRQFPNSEQASFFTKEYFC